ncbi:unnamed protein product [Zymoseptoria tritici ST99CH_3D7]|uniref:2EXR domain-containing protein n=1 Tax=Zymoseptoria tritici (strain ST99CH_3D7) TaxID=1276538 RepID=A0A1X7S853_ZYMT9|nr:unnamed protein product [Zymoseptoria tritici ST99CH_3D7]
MDWTSFVLMVLRLVLWLKNTPIGRMAGTLAEAIKQSASDDQTKQSSSRLLNLPPELRIAIWELAVTDDAQYIPVIATGYARPKLLETCKQVRSEALELFYLSNHFHFDIRGYNDSLLLKFAEPLKAMNIRAYLTKAGFKTWTPGWDGLMRWLENLHTGQHWLSLANSKAPGSAACLLVKGLFVTARALREVEWNRLKEILESMRPALVALDARWAE